MPLFLEVWLPLSACTLGALLYRSLSDFSGTGPIFIVLAIEFGSLLLWGIYWMMLYPNYLTPFRHLPTPPERRWLYGNRKEFSPNYTWDGIDTIIKAFPNSGLIRFYEALSREVLLVTSVDAIKEMTSGKPYDFGHPKQVKYMMSRITSSNFNFLNENGHKLFRKHLRPAFTVTHTRKLMPSMWDKFEEMVQLIEGELRDNSEAVIDMREYIRRVMWDISGVVMMGHDFQTLRHRDGGMGDRFAKVLSEFSGPAWVRMIMHYVDVRPLLTLLSPLFMQTSLGKSLNFIRSTLRQIITEKEVKFQKAESKEAQDLDITSASVASGIFPTSELVDNGMLFMTAGPNSSGTAMEWAIYELSRRREIQKRLRDEINGCLKSAASSSEPDAELGAQLQSLPYLSAVVNEVIRCYPFIPLSARVAEKDTTLLGERIPKDTILLLPVDILNHDTTLWGPDGGEFNPDRWLGDGALTGGATSNYAMLSFGAGPNTCIGQNIARAMLGCFLAAFVRRFDIQLANAETAAKLRPALFKRSEEGMMAKLKRVEA